jgi:hypothetical protein
MTAEPDRERAALMTSVCLSMREADMEDSELQEFRAQALACQSEDEFTEVLNIWWRRIVGAIPK